MLPQPSSFEPGGVGARGVHGFRYVVQARPDPSKVTTKFDAIAEGVERFDESGESVAEDHDLDCTMIATPKKRKLRKGKSTRCPRPKQRGPRTQRVPDWKELGCGSTYYSVQKLEHLPRNGLLTLTSIGLQSGFAANYLEFQRFVPQTGLQS